MVPSALHRVLLGCLCPLALLLACPAQTITDTVLHTFGMQSLCNPIEASPSCSTLIQASDGNFYGTTEDGGALGYGSIYKLTPSGLGTVYQATPSGTVTVLHDFTDTGDSALPYGALVEGNDSKLYATTTGDSTYGNQVANSFHCPSETTSTESPITLMAV